MTTETERAPTATLFNQTWSFPPPPAPSRLPPTLRKVAIVGGGTAGWMTAMIFANALRRHGVEISVLESPTVGIIGVGEGSTPWLRGFFDMLGIEESEWMPACNATYKCGIAFDAWSTKPGFERYFHPFASMLDNLTMTQFIHNVAWRSRSSRPSRPTHSLSTYGTATTSIPCCWGSICTARRSSAASPTGRAT
jgi:hypothetical protein